MSTLQQLKDRIKRRLRNEPIGRLPGMKVMYTPVNYNERRLLLRKQALEIIEHRKAV
jgi:hypothetical protein